VSEVGRRSRRIEDPRLLTGRGHFVDDVDRPGQLHVRFVRASVAHGRIASLDVEAARESPGVVAVLTAADVAALPPIPVRISPDPEMLAPYLQPVLASDVVRYVGEPLAAVVAEDPYIAEDAAEMVIVEYDELPVVLDARTARMAGATELFPGHGNEVTELVVGFGDVSTAFSSAAYVISMEVEVGRQTPVPIETRGLVAEWDRAARSLEIWGATKVPHFNRRVIATALGIDPSSIWMHRSDAGGGFGVRGELYPEDVLLPLLARQLGRPVKWVEDRAEHFVSVNHSRAQRHELTGAFDRSGRLLALRDEVWHDNGAYIRTHGLTVPELTAAMLPGPYRMSAFEARIHVLVTNKTPCGTFRAPGRYEGTLARERLLDAVAEQIRIDPLELRRRNLLRPDELPLDRGLRALGTGVVLDEGDYPGLLEAALEASRYDHWQEEAATARTEGRWVGAGAAVFLEKSGLGPYETATVTLARSGRLRVATGGTSLGQGIETVMAQVAADRFGVSADSVDVVLGDTAEIPDGLGSWASRSTVVGGSAVHLAASDVADAVRRAAAKLLEASSDDVRLEAGRAFIAGSPDCSLSLEAIARAVADPKKERGLDGLVLSSTRSFSVEHMTYPYGVHLALVEIDSDTGAVRVLKYFVAYEVGRAINPTNVEGQIVGGAVQGIGGALFEEMCYTESGQPLSVSLMDYQLPFASEAPEVGLLISEKSLAATNPLGARGAGEGGLTACAATIASAVGAAIGAPSLPRVVPLTPERVKRLLDSRRFADGPPDSGVHPVQDAQNVLLSDA
jgi:aerobic carbon-monoxide dehydrogenase large subunit